MIVTAITGILASMSIVLFVSFIGRTRQSEPKTNLKTWYQSQISYFSEKNTYTENYYDTGYSPSNGNRYAYRFGATCTFEVRNAVNITTPFGANCISIDLRTNPLAPISYPTPAIAATFSGTGPDPSVPGLGGTCPDCNIAAVATANVDTEVVGVDTWLISTKPGTATACGNDETKISPGIAFQAYNDVPCD